MNFNQWKIRNEYSAITLVIKITLKVKVSSTSLASFDNEFVQTSLLSPHTWEFDPFDFWERDPTLNWENTLTNVCKHPPSLRSRHWPNPVHKNRDGSRPAIEGWPQNWQWFGHLCPSWWSPLRCMTINGVQKLKCRRKQPF